jgi:hypothetical protein
MRERQETQAKRDREVTDQLRDPPLALRACRRERDDLMLGTGDLGEACERAANVVADAGRLV